MTKADLLVLLQTDPEVREAIKDIASEYARERLNALMTERRRLDEILSVRTTTTVLQEEA